MRKDSWSIPTCLTAAAIAVGLILGGLAMPRAAEDIPSQAKQPTDKPQPTADSPAAESTGGQPASGKSHENLSLRGKVVYLAEALQRRFGIETDADAVRQQVALETDEGELYPIVKDARGRGFLLDDRLRDVEMELLVRRHIGSPVVQVIRVYTIKPDGRYELDYWCDICAIPMYELKQCECCQGPIRLRERPAGSATKTAGEAGSQP
ncbi:MAG: hypothetical protein AB7O62_15935 [Pirellulales bacterium]